MNNPSDSDVAPFASLPGILVVDGDHGLVQALRALLQSSGFPIYAASSAAEALPLFRQHAPDIALVLSDADLPGEDGRGLLEAVRALAPGLPFCFMRGRSRAHTVGSLFALGANRVFGKPLHEGQLCQEMLQMLRPRAEREPAGAGSPQGVSSPSPWQQPTRLGSGPVVFHLRRRPAPPPAGPAARHVHPPLEERVAYQAAGGLEGVGRRLAELERDAERGLSPGAAAEVAEERYALKVLRGDFPGLLALTSAEDRADVARFEGEGGTVSGPGLSDAHDRHDRAAVRAAVRAAQS